MEIRQNQDSLSAIMPQTELWYLARLHAPGIVYGVENPYENMTEDQISQSYSDIVENLIKADVLRYEENTGFQIDDFINGMVFSCIHPDHMLVIKDNKEKEEAFIHFLPNWQLTLRQLQDGYELTSFRSREELWKFLDLNYLNLNPQSLNGIDIVIEEKTLEFALFLAESSKLDKAINEVLSSFKGNEDIAGAFLTDLEFHQKDLSFSMIYNRNVPDIVNQFWFKYMAGKTQNYWLTKNFSMRDEKEYLRIQALSTDNIKKKFLKLLPRE